MLKQGHEEGTKAYVARALCHLAQSIVLEGRRPPEGEGGQAAIREEAGQEA